MGAKKKSKKQVAEDDKTIKIPASDYHKIKAYVDANNHKLGKFVAQAAIEKIETLN